MKKITFAILILTISFGSAPGITVNSVQVSAEVKETTKIFSFGSTSFSVSSSSLNQSGDLYDEERNHLINTGERQEVNDRFKFYSFRNQERAEEENRTTYFSRAPPMLA
ncbi:MAG: hypothetical protein ACQEP3_01785 [Patescibacteria group bacterium]